MVLTVLSQKFTKYCLISLIWPKHRQRSGGGGGTGAKIRVWYQKHFYDCWHRRAHRHSSTLRRLKNYLKSTMNQDRLNKLEQLPKDALSQIDYWHRWKNVCLCQLKTPRVFWKIWVAVCPWLSGRWAPPVQNARRLWERVEWRGGKGQFYATDLCYRFSDLLPLPPRLVVHLVTGVKALF